jgi:hypothetical protein
MIRESVNCSTWNTCGDTQGLVRIKYLRLQNQPFLVFYLGFVALRPEIASKYAPSMLASLQISSCFPRCPLLPAAKSSESAYIAVDCDHAGWL